MFHNIMASSSDTEIVLEWIDLVALGIEVLAVVLIALSIAFATARYVYRRFTPLPEVDHYRQYRKSLGGSLLLALEVLIAADVVRTVALEATLESVVILGFLVIVRTFLGWSLTVEIEGRWPWHAKREDE
jgi:uncharacterized membrane protein